MSEAPAPAHRQPLGRTDGAPIPDLFYRPLEREDTEGLTRWPALRDTDPLLRRFGLAEVVRVTPEATPTLRCRAVADEVWALLEGKVEFLWHDLRPGSPSLSRRHRMTASAPVRVLAPFGVAFGLRAIDGPALLARFATHTDDDPEASRDRELPWPNEE